jgi:hypothetical protein
MALASMAPSRLAAGRMRSYLRAWIASRMRPSYVPKATARTKGGGASRQARHRCEDAMPSTGGASSASPHRRHAGPSWTGISAQQASQIGTEEKRGRGEPQRAQEAGSTVQVIASRGLRRTRTTARQRDVSDSEPSIVSEP